ncbi:MAG: AAA family ATPase, partial [Dehalococcoidia bacterium]|nr:AAA family ATPase [Dehalococcoidia bacterium]
IAERGVQLVGTAHGNELENLMQNPTLSDLVGGIQSVTLGDDEARRRGTQKSILERKAPPTFEVIVEIQDWHRVAIHKDVASTVDARLRGWAAPPEVRELKAGGDIQVMAEEPVYDEPVWHQPAVPVQGQRSPAEKVLRLYPFGVSRQRLDQAIRATGAAVEMVDDVGNADAVITMRTYYRRKPQALRDAEERNLPIYVIKSNTLFQMEQVVLQFRNGRTDVREDEMVEVYREAETAVARVLDEGRPVELRPQNSYIRKVQHEIAGRYNLDSRSAGKEPNRRVRILPVTSAARR